MYLIGFPLTDTGGGGWGGGGGGGGLVWVFGKAGVGLWLSQVILKRHKLTTSAKGAGDQVTISITKADLSSTLPVGLTSYRGSCTCARFCICLYTQTFS